MLSGAAPALTAAGDFVVPVGQQLRILIDRCVRIYWRSDSYNLVRSVLVVIMALLFGTVYWRMGYRQDTVWTRLSFFYTSTFYVGLTFLLSGVTILMPQRAAFYREQACEAYASWAYAVAFFIAELPYVTLNSLLFLCVTWFFAELYTAETLSPFLLFWQMALPFWGFLYMCTILGHAISAISPSMEVANAIGPGVASWFSSFAGFYLPRPYLPTGYLFIYWLNPFRYAFEGLVLTAFKDVPISCDGYQFLNATGQPLCVYKNGNDVISAMGMLPWGYGLDVATIFGYMAAFAIVALLGLRFLRFGTR
jgi:ABC-type multidrug transport system permease subunit